MAGAGAGSSGPLYIAGPDEPAVVRAVIPRTGEPLDQHAGWTLEDDWFEIVVHARGSELLLPSSTTLLSVDTDSGAGVWRHTYEAPAHELLVLDELLNVANQEARIVTTRLPDN